MLVIGVFAMVLHLLAGTGLAMAQPAAKGGAAGFVPSVCGSHAAQPVAPATPSEKPSGGNHDCCKLCAAGAPVAAPAHDLAILPRTPVAIRHTNFTTVVTPAPSSAHSPRGPPALG